MSFSINRYVIAFILSSVVWCWSCLGQAQQTTNKEINNPPSIHVSGIGYANATPDGFSISVTLEEKGPVVTKMQTSMKARMENIIEFLLSQGIEQTDIQSMVVNLYPWYENSPSGRKNKGLVLARQLVIQGQKVNKYDTIIDGLFARGIDRLDKFVFTQSKQQEITERAIINAIKDAKSKASLMAQQLGLEITEVYSLNYNQVPAFGPSSNVLRTEASSSALPGSVGYSASVDIIFKVKVK